MPEIDIVIGFFCFLPSVFQLLSVSSRTLPIKPQMIRSLLKKKNTDFSIFSNNAQGCLGLSHKTQF